YTPRARLYDPRTPGAGVEQEHGTSRARPGISVFFPAYNDAGTIASMVIEADRTCRALTDDYEVIVVENGSSDHTVEVPEEPDPLGRIVIGRLYHWAMKLLFGFTLRDVDCDFRLIRRAALERITLTSDTGMICLELVKKLQDAGCAFAEVPVHHYHRAYGKSQFFNFPRIWRTGTDILAFWWQLRRARRKEPAIGVAPEQRKG